MKPLEEVVEYLINKTQGVNVENPKANKGAVNLRKYYTEEDIPRLVDISLQIIQMQFTKSSLDNPAGYARLTTTSSAIGNRLLEDNPDWGLFTQWENEVTLGDLFIEAYYQHDYIDIAYSRKRDGFYQISATEKWPLFEDITEETITNNMKGTVRHRPKPITNMMQMHAYIKEPVIKGRTEADELDIDTVWVQAINKLQQTPWRINTRVFEAMQDNKDLFVSDVVDKDKDRELKRRSKKVEWTLTTEKAVQLKNDIFYQFVEADYRGRLYYSEPFLNFQGSDIARGILQFANSKPMDSSGEYWLAVHTACSYNQSYSIDEIPEWVTSDYKSYLLDEGLDSISVDKMTLDDRVQWTNNNMEWIRKTGEDLKFYPEAEKTVSFLACCVEWADYHEALANDEVYFTHLPIPIDGSNNGWQHLGAISKDTHTGELVGLIPVEIQKDFYVQTAKKLYELTEDPELKDLLDRMPMKHIRKGISKRGSMTRAYSAGADKIGENMWLDCKTEDFHDTYGITEANCMALAKILIKAINEVCPGPLKTMGYLQALAGVAIAQGKEKLEWSTPSGFDVVYECYYSKSCRTRGTISGLVEKMGKKNNQINHVAQVFSEFPDVRGFMCGISPNYIHSMDAAHMAKVIDKWDGDFGAVHDSFSAHATDIEHLLAHTKQEFIDMYNVENFYTKIEDELVEDMTEVTVNQPDLGTLNIEEIEDSDYFFA